MKTHGTAIFAPVVLLVLASLASPVAGQPFGAWLVLTGYPTNGWVEVAHDTALNPTAAFTFEAWVALNVPATSCRSIAGKNYHQAWAVGVCTTGIGGHPVLRSYLKGDASGLDGGIVPSYQWTHVAVVFDGSTRRHYINGELVASAAETGPLTTSTDPLRIASDVSFNFTPAGAINEVRLWNVARTQDQIRAAINVALTDPQPGLVAVWSDALHDALGHFTGTVGGSGTGFLNAPAALSCGSSNSTYLCLLDHFQVGMVYRIGGPGSAEANATTVPYYNPGSGLFYFTNPNDWQILVKVLDGCAINGHHWVGTAASTNLFYRLAVSDVHGSGSKTYFNYAGPIAASVLDTTALGSCP